MASDTVELVLSQPQAELLQEMVSQALDSCRATSGRARDQVKATRYAGLLTRVRVALEIARRGGYDDDPENW